MEDPSKPTPLLMCMSCGAHHSAESHLCSKCNAPLTPFAHTDWVLGIQARGFALQKATTAPKKLIVVVGTWLWLAPAMLLGLSMAFIGLAGLRDMIGRASYMEMCLAQIVTVVGLEFTLVPAVILYRTTSSFLRGRAVADSHLGAGGAPKTNEATDLGEEAETLNCLSCGEAFAAADQCPKCGWSFTDAG